jgi:hypothetical protein
MTIRQWLQTNNYQDVDVLIGKVLAKFKAEESGERRNWADILSGGKNGEPLAVAGYEFPVLASAQRSRGKPVTANAIERNQNEQFPSIRQTGRWPRKKKSKLPSRLTTLSKQGKFATKRSRAS